MEQNEQNNNNNPNETKEPKKKKEKTDSKSKKPGLSEFIADHKSEFKKIVWPKKIEVVKKTGTVIVTSVFVGAVIFCMVTVFTELQALIINVLN